MHRFLIAAMSLALAVTIAVPATAGQFGLGIHYLRTLEEYEDSDGSSLGQNDFGFFGSLTIPVAIVRVEGQVEWVPDYRGEQLFQPAAYGLLDIGPIYGGAGIGIGYLTGDFGGWATNPFYALRAGIDIGLAGLAVDVFASYRFQSANFIDGAQHIDLDALTLAAQVKFGG
jgi:hypothetical protein